MADPVAVPPSLRAAVAADLAPVVPLRSPMVRGLALVPIAAVLLVAAPLVFSFRDMAALGWVWSWGASALQAAAGVLLVIAALRESVPGRSWSRRGLVLLAGLPIALVAAVTIASWRSSPVAIGGSAFIIGAICLAGSAIGALPATLIAVVLAVRAYPIRPGVTGWLAGLGGGLMADAGWRLFCHFSEPSHVLATHLGGVLVAAALGALVAGILARRDQ
jgi:negative regulator of sigma F NrsF-like protein